MESLFHDIRFGARVLLRTPLIAISIILVLGLGIGANSVMFGILDGLLLHAVRYPAPDELVFVWSIDPQGALNDVSPADFVDWRKRAKTVGDLAAWVPTSFVVNGGQLPRQLGGSFVTANFFRTLRVKPILGRTFLPDEDGLEHPGNAARSVVISYRFWQEDLGADPNVLGRTIRVESTPYNIVGVMPPDFQFWWRPHDLWIPVTMNIHERDYRDLVVVGRLNAPLQQAQREADVIASSLGEAYPKSNKGWTIQLERIQERLLNRTFRARLLMLSSAVGLVLLIACTNVASLLLARSAARERELAVRVSLGASAGRLARQLLTESALLAFFGGGFGLTVAWALIRAIPRFVPAGALPSRSIELSSPVMWFCAGVSALTCLLVGLAPAITAARAEGNLQLKDSARGTTAGRQRQRFRQILVGAEVAVALMLVATAWLMTGSLLSLSRLDLGFNAPNVLTFRVLLPRGKYNTAQALGFYRLALERIGTIPGVVSAGMGSYLPLANDNRILVRCDIEGSGRQEAERASMRYAAVSPDYFRTLNIPLKRGRFFTSEDDEKAAPIAVVSEALASTFFPNEDPIGKRIVVDRPLRGAGQETVKLEIVGVTGNINLTNLSLDPKTMIYVPHRQNPFSRGVWFAVRTAGEPSQFASAARAAIMGIDREQPVEQMGSLEQMLANQYAEPRFQTELMSSFALLALVLAAVGIYGVNAYAVAQRRTEIGLRMALGATQGDVLKQAVGQGMAPTIAGIVVGLAGAAAVATWLRSFLLGSEAADPLAFLGAAALLGLVAVLACYFPARRAIRIDPAIALRNE